jgi:tRNA (guanine37-N1)-methyltransferase
MRNPMIGLEVPKKKADQIRRFLMEKKLLNLELKIKRSQDHVYFPLHQKLEDNLLQQMGLFKDNLVETGFEEQKRGPRSLKEYLEGRISPEKIEELKKSFDIIGDVVILEIPPDLEEEKHLLGEAALKVTKRKSVYRKKSEVKGVLRTRELEHLAGEDQPVTIHQEFGSRVKLDVKKVYFSPRLATERKRIADQVQEGETIIDMFAGVGPFALAIARQHQVHILAIDINPEAIHYLEENVRLNKLEGKIKPLHGDVVEVLKDREILADRIIMNLPGTAWEFLPLALKHLKPGGVLHYYQFSRDFDEPVDRVREAAYPRRVEILDKRKVKSRSPGVWHVGIDAKISY